MIATPASAIFTPFVGMMVLTFLVWLWLLVKRLGYATSHDIGPHKLQTPAQLAEQLPDRIMAPAHNLANLFELPVLFYALCLFIYAANIVDTMFVSAAYTFFIARAAHSVIHCSYNKVMHRFIAYLVSSFALWFILARVIWVNA